MTPQEKAQELIDKYLPEVRGADRYNYNLEEINVFVAKQCALIAVNEVLANIDATILYNHEIASIPLNKSYWSEVKTYLS